MKYTADSVLKPSLCKQIFCSINAANKETALPGGWDGHSSSSPTGTTKTLAIMCKTNTRQLCKWREEGRLARDHRTKDYMKVRPRVSFCFTSLRLGVEEASNLDMLMATDQKPQQRPALSSRIGNF